MEGSQQATKGNTCRLKTERRPRRMVVNSGETQRIRMTKRKEEIKKEKHGNLKENNEIPFF